MCVNSILAALTPYYDLAEARQLLVTRDEPILEFLRVTLRADPAELAEALRATTAAPPQRRVPPPVPPTPTAPGAPALPDLAKSFFAAANLQSWHLEGDMAALRCARLPPPVMLWDYLQALRRDLQLHTVPEQNYGAILRTMLQGSVRQAFEARAARERVAFPDCPEWDLVVRILTLCAPLTTEAALVEAAVHPQRRPGAHLDSAVREWDRAVDSIQQGLRLPIPARLLVYALWSLFSPAEQQAVRSDAAFAYLDTSRALVPIPTDAAEVPEPSPEVVLDRLRAAVHRVAPPPRAQPVPPAGSRPHPPPARFAAAEAGLDPAGVAGAPALENLGLGPAPLFAAAAAPAPPSSRGQVYEYTGDYRIDAVESTRRRAAGQCYRCQAPAHFPVGGQPPLLAACPFHGPTAGANPYPRRNHIK